MELSSPQKLVRDVWHFIINDGGRILSDNSLFVGLFVLTSTIIPFVRATDIVPLIIISSVLCATYILLPIKFMIGTAHSLYPESDISPIVADRIVPFVIIQLLYLLVVLGGLTLFLIPGMIWMMWYTFAIFASVFDRRRIFESFRFSHDIMRGIFWPVAIRVAWLTAVYVLLPIFLLAIIVLLLGQESLFIGTALPTLTPTNLFASFCESLFEIALMLFMWVCTIPLYFELKDRMDAKASIKNITINTIE